MTVTLPSQYFHITDEVEKKVEFSRLNSKQKMQTKSRKFRGRNFFELSRLNSTFLKKMEFSRLNSKFQKKMCVC